MELIKNYTIKNKVYICSEIDDNFESSYIKIRAKENRILSAEEIRKTTIM